MHYYHCRSVMICRDDCKLRWRLLICENELSHISLLLHISTAFYICVSVTMLFFSHQSDHAAVLQAYEHDLKMRESRLQKEKDSSCSPPASTQLSTGTGATNPQTYGRESGATPQQWPGGPPPASGYHHDASTGYQIHTGGYQMVAPSASSPQLTAPVNQSTQVIPFSLFLRQGTLFYHVFVSVFHAVL